MVKQSRITERMYRNLILFAPLEHTEFVTDWFADFIPSILCAIQYHTFHTKFLPQFHNEEVNVYFIFIYLLSIFYRQPIRSCNGNSSSLVCHTGLLFAEVQHNEKEQVNIYLYTCIFGEKNIRMPLGIPVFRIMS